MCPEVAKETEGLFRDFNCDVDSTTKCLLGRCVGVEKSRLESILKFRARILREGQKLREV